MRARYYGLCPLAPGSTLKLHRWFESPAGWIVLLEFADDRGVVWMGPEYPHDLAAGPPMQTVSGERTCRIRSTRVDAILGWTEFETEASA